MILAPAVSGATTEALLIPLVIILAAAGIVAVILHRLRLATIPAYLITGSLIGPDAIGLIRDTQAVGALSALAMIFLMFGIGLHLDLASLRTGFVQIVSAAASAILLCILALWPVGALLGLDLWPALAAAMALAVSSTAVVLRVLQARRRLHQMTGRLSLAILVVQDLAVVAMLIALPVVAALHIGPGELLADTAVSPQQPTPNEPEPSSTSALLAAAGAIALAAAACAIIVAAGLFAIPRLLAAAAAQRSSEVTVVISAAFALGAAAATAAVGLSPELGAFLAGFLLAASPYRYQLSGQIGAIRDLFVAVFFTTLGTSMNYAVIAEAWPAILAATALVLVIKTAAIGFCTYAAGATGGVALIVGLCLAQGGEFSIVIVSVAASTDFNLFNEDQVSKLTAIIVASLIIAPAMIDQALKLADRHVWPRTARWIHSLSLVDVDQRSNELAQDPEATPPRARIIIAGLGVVGRFVIDSLREHDVAVTIIEMNPATVAKQRRTGRTIVFGDVGNPDVLESAGIRDAHALVVTIPDADAALRAVREARKYSTQLIIVTRTGFLSRALEASRLGANHAVVEEIATAREMERSVKLLLAPILERDSTPTIQADAEREAAEAQQRAEAVLAEETIHQKQITDPKQDKKPTNQTTSEDDQPPRTD